MNAAPTIRADNAAALVAARLERLPIGWWHTRLRLVVGGATFCDGFDAMLIGIVLPALVGAWSIPLAWVGYVISNG